MSGRVRSERSCGKIRLNWCGSRHRHKDNSNEVVDPRDLRGDQCASVPDLHVRRRAAFVAERAADVGPCRRVRCVYGYVRVEFSRKRIARQRQPGARLRSVGT